MADEGCTHYSAAIDAHALGLRLLRDLFGDCGRPLVAWQIDPFGHSREFANLFAQVGAAYHLVIEYRPPLSTRTSNLCLQLGYDAVFLGRVDYQDLSTRLLARRLETLWQGADAEPSALADHRIFASVLFNLYNAPLG